MKSLRIAVDGRVLGQRGVGRYLANVLRAAADLKHSHQFLVYLGPHSDASLLPRDPRFSAHRLPGGHPAVAEQWALPRAARREHCDLIFYPDNSGAIRPGLPMVLTLHDTMWRRPLRDAIARPTARQRLQDAYRKAVCPRAARAARRIITISRHSARSLKDELGLQAPRLTVIPEAGDPYFSKPLPQAQARSWVRALELRHPFVLLSGAADRRKNVNRMIRAFALARRSDPRFRDVLLAITSLREGEAVTTTYAATARAAGVESSLRFLGYVSDKQMKALYQEALCFAFPSLWEGFGLPVLEAFALGCPVLASNTSALPETAGKGAVLADPHSVEGLAKGLKQACFGRPTRVAEGRRQAKRFSWAACAKAHLKVFEEAVA